MTVGARRCLVAGCGAIALASVVMGLAACAAFIPSRVELSRERLQEIVARRFPVQRRVFDVIDIGIGSPVVTLQPEANRIAIDLALSLGARPAGTMRVSQALRYEPVDHTVRLAEVTVDRFAVDGLPGQFQRQLDRLGRPLVAQLLEGQVLYTMRPKDVERMARERLQPSQPRVTANGVEIDIGAAPR